MSKVEVTIRYAVLNKNYDIVGQMENFVKVKVNNGLGGTSDFKTKIIPGDKDKPITWNETFRCGVFNYGASQKYSIRLIVGDKDEIAGTLHITTTFV